MDEKKNANNCYKNIKNEFEKKNHTKIFYNNLIKSSQKSNSRISIFTNKISNNNRKNKKEKSFNLKQKEISQTNLKKSVSIKKDIIKEKKEKNANIILGNEGLRKKEKKLFNKKSNKIKNNSKEIKGKNALNKNDSPELKRQNYNNEQNISSLKKSQLKESIYESPLINKNSEDDLVTSFEKKPSELKSPQTNSEDSFMTDKEEINNNNRQMNDKKEEVNPNLIEKKEKNEENEENNNIKNNDDDDLIEQDNEIIYVDKIKELYNEKEKKDKRKENNKSKKNKNKDRNEMNNIKVNVKTSFFNDKEKNNKGGNSIYSIQTKKTINEILNNSKEKNYKKNTYKINNKNINNSNSSIKLRSNIPAIQKCITVKKNQIFYNNIETKYNRNTSKNNQIEYLEPIQELQKNLSNQSLKFFSDKKFVNLKNNKYKKNKNEKNKLHKNLSQIEDKYEDIIFHKKLKIDNKMDYQKINGKDISSSNNKNTNISSSLNYTYKEDEIRNKKINKDKIKLKLNFKESDINNTSINNNIKLIKENKENNNNIKNKPVIYYLKKNSHLVNKNNNKLALKIDDSNSLINNCKKMFTNMSGNNIIYSRKNLGVTKVRSHEKTIGNIYNNTSYDPNRIKKVSQSNYKNDYNEININELDNSYNRKNSDLDIQNFIKNNSFIEEFDNYGKLLLNNENGLNSLRLNSFNNIPRIYPINCGSFNEIIKIEENNNFSMNCYNKTAEKPVTNNSLFMLNRLTSGDGIYMNNYIPNFNKSINFGINLNTDFNNYNMNIFNNKSIANKMNQYPIGYNMGMMSPFHNNINQTNLINLFNNNYLNFNTIQNKASSFISNNYNLNDSLFYFPNNQNISPSINIEDIIILQEKLKDIIIALNKTKTMANECFEFWNYYYNCSIYCKLEKLFPNPIESNIIRISINYELLSIMICYDYSFEPEILTKSFSILLNLMKMNYKNLIIICDYISSKISNENKNNIWVQKLKNIINSYKKLENIKINNISSAELINHNTNIILQNLHIIIKNFKTLRNESLSNFLNKIHDKTYEQINIFFREYILRTNNLNGSILASVFLRNNKKFNTLPSPYVRTKNNKEFTLVLDLDETLVHFKEKKDGEGGGILRIRPGINEFLDEVGKYYELILFTTATQDYADLLIDAVEEDKIYFDHRLYRDHAVIIDNDFVKDLNRIGRPLDKIIIVDNMPQNFRLQKDNGIMIKAFWGEDNYDTALSNLIPILLKIAKEGDDVRKGLVKYKDDILKKVSLNITKENI